ncbi:hypothetical protein E1301_Tti000174 [Triplophysa tibetana]|uniref:Uncharacterized protein n=1 Tax=Triplophysa tibetana TaxID=1572043 RepID=A0A5A9N4V6_9TELE|nr:hypothetical protein E1301_Tti000174 [Triplophysa tibetana]
MPSVGSLISVQARTVGPWTCCKTAAITLGLMWSPGILQTVKSGRQSFSFLSGSARTKRWLRQLLGTAEPQRDKRTNSAEEEHDEDGEKVVKDQGDPEPRRSNICQNPESENQATL